MRTSTAVKLLTLVLAAAFLVVPMTADAAVFCLQDSYLGGILQVNYDASSRNFVGTFGTLPGPVFGHYYAPTKTISWSFDTGVVMVTYVQELVSAKPLVFRGIWVNENGFTDSGGPWTLTKVACP